IALPTLSANEEDGRRASVAPWRHLLIVGISSLPAPAGRPGGKDARPRNLSWAEALPSHLRAGGLAARCSARWAWQALPLAAPCCWVDWWAARAQRRMYGSRSVPATNSI